MRGTRNGCTRLLFASSFILLLAGLPGTSAAVASDWMWSVTPYLWASDVNLNVKVNDRELIDERIDLPSLIDKLEFIGAIHLEGQTGRNGLFLDIYFADFNGDPKTYSFTDALPVDVSVNGMLEFTIAEVGGIFNPKADGKGVSLLYGIRMFDFDQKIETRFDLGSLSTPGPSSHSSQKLWDALVGVRYVGDIADHWMFDAKGDISVAGTDLSWTARAGFGYTYGKQRQHAVLVGYRYMNIDFSEPSDRQVDVDSEIVLGGFYLALKFGF